MITKIQKRKNWSFLPIIRISTFALTLLAFHSNFEISAQSSNGLSGFFKFDGNLTDLKANFTTTGTGVSYGADRFNEANKALVLNGTNAFLNAGTYMSGTNSFSVAMWIKRTDLNGIMTLAAKYADTGCSQDNRQFRWIINEAEQLEFIAYGTLTGGNNTSFIGNTEINDNEWHHVAFTYMFHADAAKSLKMFVDGVQQTCIITQTGGYSQIDAGTAPLAFGAMVNSSGAACGTGLFFNGLMDDLVIFNRPLFNAEVTALANAYDLSFLVLSDYIAELPSNFGTKTIQASLLPANANLTYSLNPAAAASVNISIDNTTGIITLTSITDQTIEEEKIEVLATDGTSTYKTVLAIKPTESYNTDMLVHYKLNGNFENALGTGFNGTPSATAPTLTEGFNAVGNSAYYFNGNNNVSFGDVDLNSQSFTLSFRVRFPAAMVSNVSYSLVSKRSACTTGQFFDIRAIKDAAGQRITFELHDDGQTGGLQVNFSTEEWQHVVFIKDNESSRLLGYLNGQYIGSATWTSSFMDVENTANLMISGSPCINGTSIRSFLGSMDDLRIYNKSLSDTEIRKLYVEGVPEFNLSSNFLLLERNFEQTQITITNPLETAGVTYTISPDPSTFSFVNLAINANTGLITVTPVADASGIANFTVIAEKNSKVFGRTASVMVKSAEQAGMFAYYNFNGNANESFGNTFINGTVINTPLAPDRKNNAQSSYYFSGSNSFIEIPNNSVFNFDSNRDFSISLWLKKEMTLTDQIIFDKGTNPRFTANFTANGRIRFNLNFGGTNNEELITPNRYDNNMWHNAVFTVDRDGEARIYINGELAASKTLTLTGTLSNTQPLRFGSMSGTATSFFKGYMDDIRFFDHPVSAEKAAQLSAENRPTFLSVKQLFPVNNRLINANDTIIFTFNQPINQATASNLLVYGSLSGKITGTIQTTDTTLRFIPSEYYKIGEKINLLLPKTVVAASADTLANVAVANYTVIGIPAHEKPIQFAQTLVVDDVVAGMYYSVPGDMDNDGDTDVVGISSTEGKLTVYANDGTGAFSQTDLNPTGLQDVHLADLNSDGKLDIIYISGFTVNWYRNSGSLNFAGPFGLGTLATLYNSQQYRLNTGDLDGDNDLEVIPYSFSSQQGFVYIIKNNNNGQSFASPYQAVGINVMGVQIADTNNDGINELLVAKQDGISRVNLNSALTAVTITEPIAALNNTTGYAAAVGIADLDNDGDLDYLFTTWGSMQSTSGIYWIENINGYYNSTIKTIVRFGNNSNTGGIFSRIADLDGDGDNDVISLGNSNKLFWNENLGGGIFSNFKIISSDYAPLDFRHMYPSVADFNGDQMLDVLISGATKFVVFGSKDAITLLSASPAVNSTQVPLNANIVLSYDKVLDINTVMAAKISVQGSIGGNISLDLSMSNDAKSIILDPKANFYPGEKVTVSLPGTIMSLDGNNLPVKIYTFTAEVQAGTGEMFLTNTTAINGSLRVAAADFNKDGKIDFDVMRYLNQKFYFEYNQNNGGYQFTNNSFAANSALYSNSNFELADLNNDGRLDRFNVDFYNRRTVGFTTLETGLPGSTFNINSTTTYNARDFAFGDMDNDGDLDFTLGTGLGFEWHRNNNGTFGIVIPNMVGEDIYDLKLADVTNDGRLDAIVWGSSNHMSYYENENGSFTSLRQLVQNITNISSSSYTDLDADTDLDLLVTRTITEGIAIYKNNGIGVFAKAQTLAPAVTNAAWAEFADWNADGKPDVLAAYGTVLVWFENLGTSFAEADTLITDANASHFTTADLDGDNDLDIIATNATGYKVYSNGLPPNNAPTVTNAIANVLLNEDAQQITHVSDLNTIFTDADAHPLTFLASSDTTGVLIEIQGNSLKITPAPNYFGTASITVTANDGYENASTSFTVEVTPVNDDPTFTVEVPQLVLQEDFIDKIAVALIKTSPANEIETVSYTIEQQIEFANVSILNDTIFIESLPNLFGEITATITANDGEKSVSHPFYLKVEAIDDMPVVSLSKTEIALNEDFELTDTVAIVISHPENEPAPIITFDEGYGDGIGFVNVEYSNTNDSIFISPITNAFGTDSVGIFVDGIEYKVKISVNPVNDAPVFSLEKTTLNLGKNFATTETVSVTNLSPENESNQIITYSISPSSVSFANVAIDANTGTLSISSLTDQVGSAEITITANDNQAENNSYSTVFMLNVLENQPPVLTNPIGNQSMNEDGTPIVISNATTGFSDPENDALTFSVSSSIEQVTATLENGNLTLSAASNYFGIAEIKLSASDGNSTTDNVFTLEVLSVNDAPEFELSTNLVEKQQDFEGDVSILVSAINRPENEANEQVTYTITPESVEFASVSIHAELGQITITSKPGMFGSQVFTVTANDGQTNDNLFSRTFELRVTRLNTAPTAIQLSNGSIQENMQANTLIGTLTSVDSEDTQFTYSLVSGEGDADNSQFVLTNGNELRTTAVFDFETKNSYSLRIKTDDGNGGTFETALGITITNVNELPTNISLSANTITENNANNAVVGNLSASDPDSEETFTFSLSGKSEMFAILNNQLVALQSFDFEAQSSHSVTITVTDKAANEFSKTFEILILNQNEAPTNVLLSKSSVDEKLAIGTLVGELSATDPDLNDTHTFQFTSGVAGGQQFGTDNGSFQISGKQLKTNAVFDFDVKKSYNIAIEATDAGGIKSTFIAFTIQVNNTNSTAVISEQAFELKMYPNPVNDILTLEWAEGNTPEAINVYNQTGKRIWAEKLAPSQTNVQLSASQLAAGIYYIEMVKNGQRFSKKFARQ